MQPARNSQQIAQYDIAETLEIALRHYVVKALMLLVA